MNNGVFKVTFYTLFVSAKCGILEKGVETLFFHILGGKEPI
jgi:hypothetical protein